MDLEIKNEILEHLKDLRTKFEFGWYNNAADKNVAILNTNERLNSNRARLDELNQTTDNLSDEEKIEKENLEQEIDSDNKLINEVLEYNYQEEIDSIIQMFNTGEIGPEGIQERIEKLKGRSLGFERMDIVRETRFQTLSVLLDPESKLNDPNLQEKGKEELSDICAQEDPDKKKQEANYKDGNENLKTQASSGKIGYFLKRFVMSLLALGFLPFTLAVATIAAVLFRDAVKENQVAGLAVSEKEKEDDNGIDQEEIEPSQQIIDNIENIVQENQVIPEKDKDEKDDNEIKPLQQMINNIENIVQENQGVQETTEIENEENVVVEQKQEETTTLEEAQPQVETGDDSEWTVEEARAYSDSLANVLAEEGINVSDNVETVQKEENQDLGGFTLVDGNLVPLPPAEEEVSKNKTP